MVFVIVAVVGDQFMRFASPLHRFSCRRTDRRNNGPDVVGRRIPRTALPRRRGLQPQASPRGIGRRYSDQLVPSVSFLSNGLHLVIIVAYHLLVNTCPPDRKASVLSLGREAVASGGWSRRMVGATGISGWGFRRGVCVLWVEYFFFYVATMTEQK